MQNKECAQVTELMDKHIKCLGDPEGRVREVSRKGDTHTFPDHTVQLKVWAFRPFKSFPNVHLDLCIYEASWVPRDK